MRVGSEGVESHHDRVAVRGRFRELRGAHDSARGDAVLDDERLPERLCELGRDQPRGDVGRAPRAGRNEHAHRLRRIVLRRALEREQGGEQGERDSWHS